MIEEASTRAAAAADGILARPPRADSALRAPHNAPSLAKFTTTLQRNLLAHISFTLFSGFQNKLYNETVYYFHGDLAFT